MRAFITLTSNYQYLRFWSSTAILTSISSACTAAANWLACSASRASRDVAGAFVFGFSRPLFGCFFGFFKVGLTPLSNFWVRFRWRFGAGVGVTGGSCAAANAAEGFFERADGITTLRKLTIAQNQSLNIN
jgi:hypothetical protein